ncbi:MAG: OmpA family protein [Opitutus sp.]|nr:OmpA family protein [Opitutus sp.]
MNKVSKLVLLAIAGSALLLAGCTKKPKRPDPSATVLGQQPGGGSGSLTPTDVGVTADLDSGLQLRDGVIETEDKIIGLFQPVYFDFDKSNIKETERVKLQDASKYLSENTQYRILLEGHCDWRGTAEYNLGLGDRRANAARQYLLSIGVPAAKIETLSKGSLDAATNADDATAAKDRRAEIVILKK